MERDPLRMFLVLRRGAVTELERAAELAGAAAVACVGAFRADPAWAEAFAEWEPRPGKVCLRARTVGQWEEVLALPHALAGDRAGASAVALPPRRRSERGAVLERLQAMSTDLGPPPEHARDAREALTYVLNPRCAMSSGKVAAQAAHAAVTAAAALPGWARAGCPARLVAPSPGAFAALAASGKAVAEVVDAGLTEVPPGTVTVLAWPPARPDALPEALRGSGAPCPRSRSPEAPPPPS